MVEIGAGARKKATEGDQNRELKTVVVSLPALYLTPPTLLKMRRMSPSAVMRNLPTFYSPELPFENAKLLPSTTLLASPLCTFQ